MLITYSSNNSGGSWWLKDEDWHNLEAAGWTVDWVAKQDMTGDGVFARVMRASTKDGRRLGALAVYASKEFETPGEAMREFEKITGQKASDEGCNCCGAPHCFTWGGKDTGISLAYASGEDCLPYLYENRKGGPKDLREAYEQLERADD